MRGDRKAREDIAKELSMKPPAGKEPYCKR